MRTVTIRLTQNELWELMNNFSMSYESGHSENELADRIGEKLSKAYEKFREATNAD